MLITPNIAVVIAAYNEAATVRRIVQDTLRFCAQVIVVDDGSNDDTAAQVGDLPIMLLRNETNQGKAFCLRRGFQYALEHEVDAVITLDADGQHLPQDIPRFIAMWQQYPNCLILGARTRSVGDKAVVREWWNKVGDFFISLAAGSFILDTQSGYRCYSRVIMQMALAELAAEQGFVFESALLIVAAKQQHAIVEIPISRFYIKEGRASYFRPWRDSLRIGKMGIKMLWHFGFHWKALWRVLFQRGIHWRE